MLICMYVYFVIFRESPLKPDTNTNSIKFNTWAYKTKVVENMDLFAQHHFPDIKRRKEITLALNVCKEFNTEQKIGAKVVRRNLVNYKDTNVFKFEDRVLKGFAITWYKQNVVHYVNLNTIGMFSPYLKLCVIMIFIINSF